MSNSHIELKKNILYVCLGIIFLILALQFYKLQISQTTVYAEKSYENSVKIVTQFPVRGNIYDRDGRMIVDNRPAFSLYLIPAEVNKKTIESIAQLININPDEIRKELRRAGRFQPVKVMRHNQ
jgi:penicillin-binding protein 2